MKYPIDLFIYLFFENTMYFKTYTRERGEGLKETDSSICPKWHNSWIHSIYFKPL